MKKVMNFWVIFNIMMVEDREHFYEGIEDKEVNLDVGEASPFCSNR